MELGNGGEILFYRLAAVDLKISRGLALIIVLLSDSPGKIVLWSWTLHNMRNADKSTVSLKDWTYKFANGVPTEDAYSKTWDAQKHQGQNLLDFSSTWVL